MLNGFDVVSAPMNNALEDKKNTLRVLK